MLLDIYLPGFSGLEVLRSIRSSHQPQPEFIAVTAARDFASVRDARLTGVRHYLVKPFSVRELNDARHRGRRASSRRCRSSSWIRARSTR